MLTNRQIKHLRTLAQHLAFILQTDQKRPSAAEHHNITIALKPHELIKVKLNAE